MTNLKTTLKINTNQKIVETKINKLFYLNDSYYTFANVDQYIQHYYNTIQPIITNQQKQTLINLICSEQNNYLQFPFAFNTNTITNKLTFDEIRNLLQSYCTIPNGFILNGNFNNYASQSNGYFYNNIIQKYGNNNINKLQPSNNNYTIKYINGYIPQTYLIHKFYLQNIYRHYGDQKYSMYLTTQNMQLNNVMQLIYKPSIIYNGQQPQYYGFVISFYSLGYYTICLNGNDSKIIKTQITDGNNLITSDITNKCTIAINNGGFYIIQLPVFNVDSIPTTLGLNNWINNPIIQLILNLHQYYYQPTIIDDVITIPNYSTTNNNFPNSTINAIQHQFASINIY